MSKNIGADMEYDKNVDEAREDEQAALEEAFGTLESEDGPAPFRKSRRGRGKASGDLKLSDALLAANKVMQEKFVQLRQSIFAPHDWAKQERVRAQRHVLAQTLGVHDKLVRAIEKTPSTLPATVLFALMGRYNLAANYFTVREVALSEQFIIEQKLREFEYKISHGSSDISLQSSAARGNRPDASRKGGWLKGLPRKAKDQHEANLLAVWAEAKRRNFSPESVEDMMNWAKDNNIQVQVESISVATDDKKRSKNDTRRRSHSAANRRGGWMLGLSRVPRTEEQKEHVRIWHIAQERGLKFASVKEMMSWWIVEGQK